MSSRSQSLASAGENGTHDQSDVDDLFGGDGEDAARGNDDLDDSDEKDILEDDVMEDDQLDDVADEGVMDDDVMGDDDADGQYQANVMDAQVGRHAIPHSSDGELYTLKMPTFLGIEPEVFSSATFRYPSTDHHSRDPPSSTFSVYDTATSTIRWRFDPKDQRRVQANSRILRWSDGSLTLQHASNPLEQFVLPAKALAPQQINSSQPTPTSKPAGRGHTQSTEYEWRMDSNTYLATPQEGPGLLRTTNHVTTSLTVLPSEKATDDALVRLQESLASAVRAKGASGDGIGIINIKEDPELAKKKAEIAEREKLKLLRRREQAETRERARHGRAFGGAGLGGRRALGLSAGGLEEEAQLGGVRTGPSKRAGPRTGASRHRGTMLDEEDERDYRRFSREDEYDEEDDFVAPSDEEIEEPSASEEEAEAELDEDAEGEDDDIVPQRNEPSDQPSKTTDIPIISNQRPGHKKRRVIEDDDDEE